MSITDLPSEFAPKPRPAPRLVPTDEEISEVVGRPVASILADTDLQRIAALVAALTYGDMKALASGVLGKDDQAEIIVLADRLHAWADATMVAAGRAA